MRPETTSSGRLNPAEVGRQFTTPELPAASQISKLASGGNRPRHYPPAPIPNIIRAADDRVGITPIPHPTSWQPASTSGQRSRTTDVDGVALPCHTSARPTDLRPTDFGKPWKITTPHHPHANRNRASCCLRRYVGVSHLRNVTAIIGTPADGCCYAALLSAIDSDPELQLDLMVCGRRTSPELDTRCCTLVAAGFEIRRRVELTRAAETNSDVVTLPTHERIAFAEALHSKRSDLVLLLGESEELLSAAQAARTAGIPIAQVINGPVEPNIQQETDHAALAEICHLHFVTNETDQQALVAQGEDAWRIHVAGSPRLDQLRACPTMKREELEDRLGCHLEEPLLVVSYLPDSDAKLDDIDIDGSGDEAEQEITESQQVQNLLEAIEILDLPTVFAYPRGSDISAAAIEALRCYADQHENTHLVPRCEWPTYWNLLRQATALAGNDAAAIVEAGWLKLPVVNIGTRQAGRPKVDGLLNSGYGREEIFASIATVVAKEFPDLYPDQTSPYGDGTSAAKIVAELKNVTINERLLKKLPRQAVAMPLTAARESVTALQ